MNLRMIQGSLNKPRLPVPSASHLAYIIGQSMCQGHIPGSDDRQKFTDNMPVEPSLFLIENALLMPPMFIL